MYYFFSSLFKLVFKFRFESASNIFGLHAIAKRRKNLYKATTNTHKHPQTPYPSNIKIHWSSVTKVMTRPTHTLQSKKPGQFPEDQEFAHGPSICHFSAAAPQAISQDLEYFLSSQSKSFPIWTLLLASFAQGILVHKLRNTDL